MSEFKQCPNGHFYQGDKCPYCPSSKAPQKQLLVRVLKACHNLHAYDAKHNMCPICDSSIVVDKFTRKSSDTALVMSIRLTNSVHVKVGALELSECNYIHVTLPHVYKNGYFFTATQNYLNDEALEIVPDKKIVFGTMTMTGKEFIRLCDLIFDNNLSVQSYSDVDVSPDDLIQLQEILKQVTMVPIKTPNKNTLEYGHNVFNSPTIGDDGRPVYSVKVCPNGHGYDVNQMVCPFCGSDIVSEVIEERCGFTLITADLSYEKDGVPILCQHAKVNGEMLSGDLCLRIEYTGSFKYAYYVSQKDVNGGLIVNPQSHIELSGDGFSDSFTGQEFYKMCDMLLEQNEKLTSDFKQCPNGHNFQEEQSSHKPVENIGLYTAPYTCKACGAWSSEYNGGHCPYCGERLKGQPEDIYPLWLDNKHKTTIIPVCEHCGHRIRKSIPSSFIQVYNNIIPPWNHEWDGKCEFCGHDYSIHIEMPVFFSKKKKTYVKADSKIIDEPCNLDQYRVLSGVTIKTDVGNEAEKNCEHGEVFLTANELKVLIKLLKDSPLLEQYDYDDSNYM